MGKEEILIESYKELKDNLTEFNRNIIFIDDILTQKIEEFEEENNEKLNFNSNKFTLEHEQDLNELENKINESLINKYFDNYYDLFKFIKDKIEFFEGDLELISSSLNLKTSNEILLYNGSKIIEIKNQVKLVLNKIDEIIDNIKNLK